MQGLNTPEVSSVSSKKEVRASSRQKRKAVVPNSSQRCQVNKTMSQEMTKILSPMAAIVIAKQMMEATMERTAKKVAAQGTLARMLTSSLQDVGNQRAQTWVESARISSQPLLSPHRAPCRAPILKIARTTSPPTLSGKLAIRAVRPSFPLTQIKPSSSTAPLVPLVIMEALFAV